MAAKSLLERLAVRLGHDHDHDVVAGDPGAHEARELLREETLILVELNERRAPFDGVRALAS